MFWLALPSTHHGTSRKFDPKEILCGEFCTIFPEPGTVDRGGMKLRWPNTVCARFTDSVSDVIKRALGLWYANTTVDKVIPHFHMKWIIKFIF